MRSRSRSAPAGVEPAVSDGQPLLESKDELGIRSPVGVFAESSDGDRGARRREFRSAGLRVTGCTERDENAVEPHRRSTAALSGRSEEHTSELQSLMRSPYAVLCV